MHSLVEMLNEKAAGKEVSARQYMASIEGSRTTVKQNLRQWLSQPIEQATTLAQRPKPPKPTYFHHQTSLYYKKDLTKNAILANQVNAQVKMNRLNVDTSGELVTGVELQELVDTFMASVKNIHSISLLRKNSAAIGVEILCRKYSFKLLIMLTNPILADSPAQIAIRVVNVLHLEEKTEGNEYLPSKYPSLRLLTNKIQSFAMTHRLEFPANHFRKFMSWIESNLPKFQ